MSEFNYVDIPVKIHRLINSAFPPKGLFDTLGDNDEELRILFELEMMTNPRNNILVGRLAQIPDGSIVTGNTANIIMAAFVHSNDDGGRFNDERLGAWYASFDVLTAIEETVYHLQKRLELSEGGFPQQIQMRQLITTVNEPLLNICGAKETHSHLYDEDDYSKSQEFANEIRWPFDNAHDDLGEPGIRYDSVRHEGGVNVCIFKPAALDRPVTQGAHYQYDWNSAGQVTVSKLKPVKRSTS